MSEKYSTKKPLDGWKKSDDDNDGPSGSCGPSPSKDKDEGREM